MSDSISIGAIIFIAVKPIVKIYLIVFLGWLLVKNNILTMETSRGISNMVVNALLPCLSFNKIVTNLSGSQIKEIGVVVLSAIVIFGTGGALAALASFITPVPKKWVWGLIFGGIFANISDLPIAYIQSMGTGIVFDSKDADKGVALSCVFLACQQFLMMNMGMFQIVGLDFREPEKKKDEENNVGNGDVDQLSKNETPTEKDEDFKVRPLVHKNTDEEEEDNDSDAISERSYATNRSGRSNIRSTQNISRRRRSSAVSGYSIDRIRSNESGYSSRSKRKPQNMKSLIDEYSEADRIRSQHLDLAKTVSKTQEIGLNLDIEDDESERTPTRYRQFIEKYNLYWFDYMIVNLGRPASVVLIISITVTMIPWLRALFVNNSIEIHSAPDKLPPLNFIMDFTSYIGVASIPMGLLLLGGTIARLEIHEIPKGFWKTSLFLTLARLVIMPILGVLWTNRLYSAGWIEDDVSRFILIISWAVPSATAQVYFTAFYTPLEGDHIQMDCLAIFLMMQYPILAITLAITVCYALKVNLGY
ncbi:putative membrane protein [Wickerhamomyces ciferrii]|uniref:Membrane protein n=1 Tax=Wickerhamomyces ciferrii (strain ATCC 14091 / BCRC 22168 / CBS 111 / JCM 3599 / NBRC 0793 / NRRL Y-1031 F-60-10) TaxID=1206466 RepID=K0KV93_WICCF|nr:uncharacterized protein BN7_4661 [Wickerhamomyces ciferrii]CCH45083.1 putative membrane protein [Wickerhamomyces ciferrii]